MVTTSHAMKRRVGMGMGMWVEGEGLDPRGGSLAIGDWSLITGRGGAMKWENHGSETFCAPPPKTG